MEIVRKAQVTEFTGSPSVTIWEFLMEDDQVNGAIAEINGRYPESGRVVNEESKELIYVLEGRGKIVVDGEDVRFERGDLLLIAPGERYYWEGDMRIFMANTPKWQPEQHKFVE